MNKYDIIKLERFDAECLTDINNLLAQLSSSGKTLSEDGLKEILSSDSCGLYLLKDGEKTIGMFTLACYVTPTGKKCWLEDVVVASECRGMGLGRMLMNKVNDIVSEMGDVTLMLTSKPARLAANGLYQSSGFDRKETNVYIKSFNREA